MAFDPAPHVLLVVAPYYRDITEQLVLGAVTELERAGATWERHDVAGAFEIPTAIGIALAAEARGVRPFDGYVALGCVIRGETSHYDHICNETARALMDLAVARQLALGFGVLTCENGEQARARAWVDRKNKGGEAARACLMTLELKRSFGLYPGRRGG
jgi:6,7-dimethyl-8-ribityllumazine synthase